MNAQKQVIVGGHQQLSRGQHFPRIRPSPSKMVAADLRATREKVIQGGEGLWRCLHSNYRAFCINGEKYTCHYAIVTVVIIIIKNIFLR